MDHILQTTRLLLREFGTDDADNFYRLNLNPNVIRYTGDSPFESVKEANEFLANYTDYKRNGYGRWAVLKKDTGKFIGWCGLKLGEIGNETDIGFRFFEEEWNKGYATESASACLNYGFDQLGLNRIIGRAMNANVGSIKVLKKIGMDYEKDVNFDGQAAVVYKAEK